MPAVLWTNSTYVFGYVPCLGYDWYIRETRWPFAPYNTIGWFDDSSMPFNTAVTNSAQIALLNKMKERDADLGLMLLERKETEHLLLDVLKKITKSIQVIKQIRRRGMAQVWRAYKDSHARGHQIPEWWLELQYGWKPLMSDVYKAMKVVEQHQLDNDYRIFHKVRTEVGIDPLVGTFRDSQLPFNVYVEGTVAMKQRNLIRVDYILETSTLGTLASVGLANPLSLVWERVPFSFVLDWFLPLGSWFNTFDARCGKSFGAGSSTQVVKSTGVAWRVIPSGDTVGSTPVGGDLHCLRMRRDILHSFPNPAPPTFKNPCSPVHVANALSLLATALFSGVPPHLRR